MGETKILIFKLGKESYATDIMEVERILGYDSTTKLPEVPSFFEGVIKYEDGTLPIINLNSRFNLEVENVNSDERKIIVVKRDEDKFGILVDNVTEVRNINIEELNNSDKVSTKISKKYIKCLIRTDKEIIILLDLNKILTEEEENIMFQVN